MAEAHFTEVENVIEFYKAHEINAKKVLSLAEDKYGADDHLLSLSILASLNAHPGAVPDFALAARFGANELDKLIALMTEVIELEKRVVTYVKELAARIKMYEETL
ncbi:hypothetical protein Q9L58_005854 [Maublancomyces gigas]|uniref:Uncharacterized protein n=1 Tax=Discina gigas TaxID=1032678 RepID=A0ABR3GH74_9PEZI